MRSKLFAALVGLLFIVFSMPAFAFELNPLAGSGLCAYYDKTYSVGEGYCKDATTSVYCDSNGNWIERGCIYNEKCESGKCIIKKCTANGKEYSPGGWYCNGDLSLMVCGSTGEWVERRCEAGKTKCCNGNCLTSFQCFYTNITQQASQSVQTVIEKTAPTAKTCEYGGKTFNSGKSRCKDGFTLATCADGSWSESFCSSDTACISNSCKQTATAPTITVPATTAPLTETKTIEKISETTTETKTQAVIAKTACEHEGKKYVPSQSVCKDKDTLMTCSNNYEWTNSTCDTECIDNHCKIIDEKALVESIMKGETTKPLSETTLKKIFPMVFAASVAASETGFAIAPKVEYVKLERLVGGGFIEAKIPPTPESFKVPEKFTSWKDVSVGFESGKIRNIPLQDRVTRIAEFLNSEAANIKTTGDAMWAREVIELNTIEQELGSYLDVGTRTKLSGLNREFESFLKSEPKTIKDKAAQMLFDYSKRDALGKELNAGIENVKKIKIKPEIADEIIKQGKSVTTELSGLLGGKIEGDTITIDDFIPLKNMDPRYGSNIYDPTEVAEGIAKLKASGKNYVRWHSHPFNAGVEGYGLTQSGHDVTLKLNMQTKIDVISAHGAEDTLNTNFLFAQNVEDNYISIEIEGLSQKDLYEKYGAQIAKYKSKVEAGIRDYDALVGDTKISFYNNPELNNVVFEYDNAVQKQGKNFADSLKNGLGKDFTEFIEKPSLEKLKQLEAVSKNLNAPSFQGVVQESISRTEIRAGGGGFVERVVYKGDFEDVLRFIATQPEWQGATWRGELENGAYFVGKKGIEKIIDVNDFSLRTYGTINPPKIDISNEVGRYILKNELNYQGFFHTHPDTAATMSISDVRAAALQTIAQKKPVLSVIHSYRDNEIMMKLISPTEEIKEFYMSSGRGIFGEKVTPHFSEESIKPLNYYTIDYEGSIEKVIISSEEQLEIQNKHFAAQEQYKYLKSEGKMPMVFEERGGRSPFVFTSTEAGYLPNEATYKYVYDNVKNGVSADEIIQKLKSVGWNANNIGKENFQVIEWDYTKDVRTFAEKVAERLKAGDTLDFKTVEEEIIDLTKPSEGKIKKIARRIAFWINDKGTRLEVVNEKSFNIPESIQEKITKAGLGKELVKMTVVGAGAAIVATVGYEKLTDVLFTAQGATSEQKEAFKQSEAFKKIEEGLGYTVGFGAAEAISKGTIAWATSQGIVTTGAGGAAVTGGATLAATVFGAAAAGFVIGEGGVYVLEETGAMDQIRNIGDQTEKDARIIGLISKEQSAELKRKLESSNILEKAQGFVETLGIRLGMLGLSQSPATQAALAAGKCIHNQVDCSADLTKIRWCNYGEWQDYQSCTSGTECDSTAKTCVRKTRTECVYNAKTYMAGQSICKDKNTLMTCSSDYKWTESACPSNYECPFNYCIKKEEAKAVTPAAPLISNPVLAPAVVAYSAVKTAVDWVGEKIFGPKAECSSNEVKCSDDKKTLYFCANGKWQSRICAEGTVCDASQQNCVQKAAETKRIVCTKNQFTCQGNNLMQCSDDGTELKLKFDCAAAGQICKDNRCQATTGEECTGGSVTLAGVKQGEGKLITPTFSGAGGCKDITVTFRENSCTETAWTNCRTQLGNSCTAGTAFWKGKGSYTILACVGDKQLGSSTITIS